MLGRRAVVGGIVAVPLLAARVDAVPALGRKRLAALETRSGGRLGVAILDTGSGRHAGWRSDERFPMMSTFKLLAVAAVLHRVDYGRDRLDREVMVTPDAVVGTSPVTRLRVGGAMSLLALCAAAVVVSDNGAANVLLGELGGPGAVTDFARSLDDATTRLDRTEPTLNEGLRGDLRDTTSPAAMLENLKRLLLGTGLADDSRRRLLGWLTTATTGAARLRAGLPGWTVADKTGTADAAGTSNDIAVAWPPGRPPLVVVAYLTRSPLDGPGRDAILAGVGRIAATV